LPAVAIVVFGLVAAGVIVWVLNRDAAEGVAARAGSMARKLTGAAEPPGSLQVDALPWGRILSVNGGGREWITDVTFTPSSFAVPPGSYSVVIGGPDGKSQQTATVIVRSGEQGSVRLPFAAADATAYFRRLQ
jgi:hypothetical protein